MEAGSLETKIQAVMSHPLYVLRIELGSPGRAVYSYHWAISPTLSYRYCFLRAFLFLLSFFKKCIYLFYRFHVTLYVAQDKPELFFFFLNDRVFLYSSGCPEMHCIDQTGLELTEIHPGPASWVLGSKACTTTPNNPELLILLYLPNPGIIGIRVLFG